jgi:hypothetical protein
MTIAIDESGLPLLVARSRGHIEDHEVQGVIDAVSRHIAAGRPFGMVIDTVGSEPLDAKQRRMLSVAFKDHQPGGPFRVCGMVIASAVLRGATTAMVWINPPPFALEVFKTEAEARAFVEEKLAGR